MAIRERRNTGPEGVGTVKVLKNAVQIHLDDGSIHEIPKAGVEGAANGKFRVSISRAKDKAYLHPLPGQYIFSLKQFGNRQGSVPMMKIQPGGPRRSKSGGTWVAPDEQVFVGVFQVESENIYKGLTCSTNLPFSFTSPESGPNCDLYDSKRNLSRLELFLRVVGGVENMGMFEIPYQADPSAILVWLEKYLLKQGRFFTGTIGERGFLDIETLSSIPDELLPKKRGKK